MSKEYSRAIGTIDVQLFTDAELIERREDAVGSWGLCKLAVDDGIYCDRVMAFLICENERLMPSSLGEAPNMEQERYHAGTFGRTKELFQYRAKGSLKMRVVGERIAEQRDGSSILYYALASSARQNARHEFVNGRYYATITERFPDAVPMSFYRIALDIHHSGPQPPLRFVDEEKTVVAILMGVDDGPLTFRENADATRGDRDG